MLQVGDRVITMAAPGHFRVVAMEGLVVTIENQEGIRKTVLEMNIRKIQKARVDSSREVG